MASLLENPITLFQAVRRLMATTAPEELATWGDEEEYDAVALTHHGIGRRLRNDWGLWQEDSKLAKYMRACGFFHADDMSGIILASLHRELNNKPWFVEAAAEKNKKYWRETLPTDEFNKMYGDA